MIDRSDSLIATPPRTPLSITLNTMRRKHVKAILRIENQVYTQPWTQALFISELALRTNRAYMVAQFGDLVVGYTGQMLVGDDAHVTNIAVDPLWQKHQIATRLMLQNMRVAKARGAKHMTLEVRMSNKAAQHLYQKFRFAPAGVRKNYYPEDKEDALIMWANDIDTAEYEDRLLTIEAGLLGETVVSLRD